MNPFYSTHSISQPDTNQPASSATEQALANILKQENESLEQVIELLKVEHEAIVQRDTEKMGSLLDKKLPLLSQLDQLDKERQDIFQQRTGYAYSNKSYADFIRQHSSVNIQQLWQSIKEQLSECKELNELNGKMINIRQKNTDQILQILSGKPQNNPQTYSHLGQTRQQKRSALYTSV